MGKKLSEKIISYRKQLGYTQESFGALLGAKRTTYSNWEQQGKFSTDVLIQIAHIFGMTLEQLLSDTELTTPVSPIFRPIVPDKPTRLTDNDESSIAISPVSELKLTATEKCLIRTMRTLSKEERNEIIGLTNEFYKKRIMR